MLPALKTICSDLTSTYDESHDVQHHIAVYTNALNIFNSLDNKSDRLFTLISVAAMVHDTIDHKYPNTYEVNSAKLKTFLLENYPNDHDDIWWIINNMSYSKEVKVGYPHHNDPLVLLARDIVSDADKIESLGEIGIKRCREFSLVLHPDYSESQITERVVRHCHEKLIKLRDNFIRTIPGKKMAEEGHNVIIKFMQQNHYDTYA